MPPASASREDRLVPGVRVRIRRVAWDSLTGTIARALENGPGEKTYRIYEVILDDRPPSSSRWPEGSAYTNADELEVLYE